MKHFVAYVACMVTVIIATIIVAVTVSADAAWFVSYGGTFFVLCLFMGIAVVDSKRRWPKSSSWQRLINILTFTR